MNKINLPRVILGGVIAGIVRASGYVGGEPAMGIAIAWRKGDTLPTLMRLRELAEAMARVRSVNTA